MGSIGKNDGASRQDPPARLELGPAPWEINEEKAKVSVGLGTRLLNFIASIRHGIANAMASARDAIVSFFRGRDATVDPLMHIHQKVEHSQESNAIAPSPVDFVKHRPTIYSFSGNSPAEVEPVSAQTCSPISTSEPLQESRAQGMLGAIPVKSPDAVQEAKIDPPGKQKFDAFRVAFKEEKNVDAFVSDLECVDYARSVTKISNAMVLNGNQPSDELNEMTQAAQDLVNAHADQKIRARQEEERALRDAEKLRKAEELASKVPGQQDFEAFVEAYASHQKDNLKFEIYPGSKYLGDDCFAYAKGLPGPLSAKQKAALGYLETWRHDPDRARQRVQGSETFVDLTEPEPVAQASAPSQPSVPPEAPPSVPVPRWKIILKKIPSLSERARGQIGALFGMRHDEIEKAFAGLLKLASTDAIGPDQSNLGSALPKSVEAVFNYSAEASRQSEKDLESIEMANNLIEKIKGQKVSIDDPAAKDFIDQLDAVKTQVSRALEKKIQALRPKKQSTSSQPKIRMPSVLDLSDQQATAGSELFEKFVDAYKRLSNSPTYNLPDSSPYFKAECLAYADDFVNQVGRMPLGVDVDERRLAASVYLRSEARRRGIAAL